MQAVLVCDGERCAMLVFWKQGLVFLSVPKTGTTAWEEALAPYASIAVLDPPDLKHAPLYRYNRFFRPMFEKVGQGNPVETLAVVREPVSWLGSWYRFRRRPFMQGKKNATFDISFDELSCFYMVLLELILMICTQQQNHNRHSKHTCIIIVALTMPCSR